MTTRGNGTFGITTFCMAAALGVLPAHADMNVLGVDFGAPTINGTANVSSPQTGNIIFDTSTHQFFGQDDAGNWLQLSGALLPTGPTLAVSNAVATAIPAYGDFVFSGQPSAGNYVCLNGYHFPSCATSGCYTGRGIALVSGTPGTCQAQIGATLSATITNLVTAINANMTNSDGAASNPSSGVLRITAGSNFPGTSGNDSTPLSFSSSVITLSHVAYADNGVTGGANTSVSQVSVNGGGLKYVTGSATQPTCDSGHQGLTWFVPSSGAGVKDSFQICAQDTTNTFAWRTLY